MGKKIYQPSEYYNNPDPIVPDMFADPRSYAPRSFFLKPLGGLSGGERSDFPRARESYRSR